jgi:hypothetical protein
MSTRTHQVPGAAAGWALAGRAAVVLTAVMMLTSAAAAQRLQPLWYAVTTETGMPHLEENLRYTITHEKRCIGRDDLPRLFPILAHPALQGCVLQDEQERSDGLVYRLVCTAAHGTTGQATWRLDSPDLHGTLNIRLGGKNMTFYQRVTAVPLGHCAN